MQTDIRHYFTGPDPDPDPVNPDTTLPVRVVVPKSVGGGDEVKNR